VFFFCKDLAYWVPVFDELHYSDPETLGQFALYEPVIDFPNMVSSTWVKREVEFSKHPGARRHEIQLGQNFDTVAKKQADHVDTGVNQFESFKQRGIEMQSAGQERHARRSKSILDTLDAGGLRSSVSSGSPNLTPSVPEQPTQRASRVKSAATVGGAPSGDPVTDETIGSKGSELGAGVVADKSTRQDTVVAEAGNQSDVTSSTEEKGNALAGVVADKSTGEETVVAEAGNQSEAKSNSEEKGVASEALASLKASQGQAVGNLAGEHDEGVDLEAPTKAWQRVRQVVVENNASGVEGKR